MNINLTLRRQEQRLLKALVANQRIGLYAENIRTSERLLEVHASALFPTASVIKIAIIVALYNLVDKGELSLNEVVQIPSEAKIGGSGILVLLSYQVHMTLKDLAILMMHLSDNTATNILIQRIGVDLINALLRKYGLQQTCLIATRIDIEVLGKNPSALGVTTPSEMGNFLKQLTLGDILTPQSRTEVLTIMKRDVLNRRLSGQLPMRRDLFVFHKSGTAEGVYNDVGIVHCQDEAYVFCAFTHNAPPTLDPRRPAPTEELIAALSRSVFDQVVSS
jgi:beta-lactamase class A